MTFSNNWEKTTEEVSNPEIQEPELSQLREFLLDGHIDPDLPETTQATFRSVIQKINKGRWFHLCLWFFNHEGTRIKVGNTKFKIHPDNWKLSDKDGKGCVKCTLDNGEHLIVTEDSGFSVLW